MNKKLQWRAYYGFKPSEYAIVQENDLEKTKYAMVSGDVIQLGDKTLRGSQILRIEQDFRYYTGWYDTFSPKDADDFAQIERDVPKNELLQREKLSDERVNFIAKSGDVSLLKNPEKIDVLLLN